MRAFQCSYLGYRCSWNHIATEDLLTDMVALHLRDVHGIREVDSDMIGKIRNLFTYPTAADAAGAADLVMKEYNCDLGPECTWRYIAMTEDLITDGVAVHAREVHGIREFSQALIAQVKKSIHEWTGDGRKAA